uniref:glycerophosphoryl diester phosphodiesterase membrane domain-containing protein n=1 Tax=Altererythrobacter segetis TaxID=1104773 RepID=UPI00140D9C73|nr:glycerophosphoryl diester phosphodiesterase membrane domain-containing protein [Altererythrobacter segetis]
MAAVAPRELKIGAIIDKTLGVLERTAGPALAYFAALTAIDCAITYFTLSMIAPLQALAIGLLKMVVGIVAGYLLLDAMVRKTGLRSGKGEDTFLTFFGLSLLSGFAVLVGLILLIIPGLFLIARWSIAQPLVVARGDGVMQAFGESWERTRGNEFQILMAMLALLALFIAIAIAGAALFEKTDIIGIVIGQVGSSAISAASLAMGVALYGLIVGAEKDVAATFE